MKVFDVADAETQQDAAVKRTYSHVGIQENESVDLLVGQTSNSADPEVRLREPVPESPAYARSAATDDMRHQWTECARNPANYFWREFHRHAAFRRLSS